MPTHNGYDQVIFDEVLHTATTQINDAVQRYATNANNTGYAFGQGVYANPLGQNAGNGDVEFIRPERLYEYATIGYDAYHDTAVRAERTAVRPTYNVTDRWIENDPFRTFTIKYDGAGWKIEDAEKDTFKDELKDQIITTKDLMKILGYKDRGHRCLRFRM